MTLVILIAIGFLTWREKEDYSCRAVSTHGLDPFIGIHGSVFSIESCQQVAVIKKFKKLWSNPNPSWGKKRSIFAKNGLFSPMTNSSK